MLRIAEVSDRGVWDAQVNALGGHPLQLWEWGALKTQTGPWDAHRVALSDGERPIGFAQVLVRQLPWPFRAICYVPRGPLVPDASRFAQVCDALATWCRRFHPVSVKIEPEVRSGTVPGWPAAGWRQGKTVLIPRTAQLPLDATPEELLTRVHSKNARNYIRRGARQGIEVEPGTAHDLPAVLEIYRATSARDGFAIHPESFYRTAFAELGETGQLMVARHEGRVVAFLWNVVSAGCAFELWAGANDEGRRARANYPLKWGAILAARAAGASRYDMNGLLNDGISEFKRSFVKEETNWMGTFERPLGPLFPVWDRLLPMVVRAYRALRGAPRARGAATR